ncbi:MAG TPA: hypothetical protein PLU22_19835 [Polyangiaceae bacterium]|nr:hypothetical protein [Polyangiaceae bacterium]
MLIDSKATMERIKQSPHAKGIVGELADELSFAKEDKKLSVVQREQLKDLACWLFALGADDEVLRLGELMLQITPESDQERWSPIDLGLAMPWVLAQRRSDADLIARIEAKMAQAVTKRNPAFKAVFEKVEARQMNGEHLHDDEIAKARAAQKTWMEVHAMTRQLSRLCWILARGASEKMPKALLEEKIAPCVAFLRAHTDLTLAEAYPG